MHVQNSVCVCFSRGQHGMWLAAALYRMGRVNSTVCLPYLPYLSCRPYLPCLPYLHYLPHMPYLPHLLFYLPYLTHLLPYLPHFP